MLCVTRLRQACKYTKFPGSVGNGHTQTSVKSSREIWNAWLHSIVAREFKVCKKHANSEVYPYLGSYASKSSV